MRGNASPLFRSSKKDVFVSNALLAGWFAPLRRMILFVPDKDKWSDEKEIYLLGIVEMKILSVISLHEFS